MLMLTEHVAGVFFPIILSIFLFLKKLLGPKIRKGLLDPKAFFKFLVI